MVKNLHPALATYRSCAAAAAMLAERVERGAWEAALVALAVAALTALLTLALVILRALGLAHPSPLTWYALGRAVGTSLGLATLLFLASLGLRAARRLKERAPSGKTQR